MAQTNKDFPRGFQSWLETSIEISQMLFSAELNEQIEFPNGTGQSYEIIEAWTDEFEFKTKNSEWDGDWLDTLETFIRNKITRFEYDNR